MSTHFTKFRELHRSTGLFVLPNVWNAKSAMLFEEKNFPALATSSSAVASSLGYEDGEGMPFNDYLFVIKRILSSVQIPLSVDIEMGYGASDEEIYENILMLIELGVIGINIEDSIIINSKRVLGEANKFAKTIGFIKGKLVLKNIDLFINVRCDTYILNVNNKQRETSHRLKMYETTGADGIFLPCICLEEDIAEAISNTKLPINVMCTPDLPDFENLQKLGVKRVSIGPFLFNKVYEYAGQLSKEITAIKNFSPLLS